MGSGASCSKPNLPGSDIQDIDQVAWAGRPHDRVDRYLDPGSAVNGKSAKPPFTASITLPSPRVGPRLSSSPSDSPQASLRAKITPSSTPYTTIDRSKSTSGAHYHGFHSGHQFTPEGSLKPPRSPVDSSAASYTGANWSGESTESGSIYVNRTQSLVSGSHRARQQSKSELSDCPRIYASGTLRSSKSLVERWRSNPDTVQRSLPRIRTLDSEASMSNYTKSANTNNNFDYPNKSSMRQSPKFRFRKNSHSSSHGSDPVRSSRLRSDVSSDALTPRSDCTSPSNPSSLGSQTDSAALSGSSRGTNGHQVHYSLQQTRSDQHPSKSSSSNSNVIKRNVAVLKRPPSLLMSSFSKKKDPEGKSPLLGSLDFAKRRSSSTHSMKDVAKQEQTAAENLECEVKLRPPKTNAQEEQQPTSMISFDAKCPDSKSKTDRKTSLTNSDKNTPSSKSKSQKLGSSANSDRNSFSFKPKSEKRISLTSSDKNSSSKFKSEQTYSVTNSDRQSTLSKPKNDRSSHTSVDEKIASQMFRTDPRPQSVPTVSSGPPKIRRSLRKTRLSKDSVVKPLPVESSQQRNLGAIFDTSPAYHLAYPIIDKDAVLARILRRFLSQSLPFSHSVLAALCSSGLLSTRSCDSALLREEGVLRSRYILERLHVSRHGLISFSHLLTNFINVRSLPVSHQFLKAVVDVIQCVVDLVDILVDCVYNPALEVIIDASATSETSPNRSDSLGELRQELQKTVDRIFGPKSTRRSGVLGPSDSQSGKSFSIEVLYQSEDVSGSLGTSADRLDVGYKMYDNDYTDTYRPVLAVELSGLRLTDDFWSHMGHLIRKYNNISELSLCGCGLQPDHLDSLLGSGGSASAPSLRLLNLRLNTLGDVGASLLRAPRLPCLRHLSLACSALSPSALWSSLPLLRRLHALDLGYNDLSMMPEPLLLRICALPQLRMLRLRNTALSPACLELVCESLKRVRQLQTLDISGHRLTRLNINALSAGIASCGALRELNLEQCNIIDEDCSIFSKALLMNRNLEELELSGNRVGDRGAAFLAGVLRDKVSLRWIGLNRCGLSLSGLMCLLKAALSPASKVRGLHLVGNEFFSRQDYDQHFKEILQSLTSLGKKIIL